MNASSIRRGRLGVSAAAVMIALAAFSSRVDGAAAGIVASATGSGQTTTGGELRTFSFVAVLGSDGVAEGIAQVNNRMVGEMFQLNIDCLKVAGNVAIVSGVFTRHTDAHAIGLTGIFAVQDAGEGSLSADRITQVFFFEPGVISCSDLVPADAEPFLVDIEAGNIQVH